MGRPREFDDQAVIRRAMQSFWTHGYAGTSPALLVESTGLGKGSLYNAFHSKRELFDRCLDEYQDQVRQLAQELLSQPGSTVECLRSCLRAIVDDDVAQPQRRGCLIGNTISELAGEDTQLARRLKSFQDESTGWFAERIRRGQVEGDVPRERDPEALADHFATLLAGLRVMSTTHDAKTLHAVIDTTLTLLR